MENGVEVVRRLNLEAGAWTKGTPEDLVAGIFYRNRDEYLKDNPDAGSLGCFMSHPPNHLNAFQIAMVKASAQGMDGSAEQNFISAVDDRLGLIGYDQFGAAGPTTPQVKAAMTAELMRGK